MSKFLKVIIGLILLGAVAVTGALVIPPQIGITTLIIDPSEMSTNLQQGTVVYAKNTMPDTFASGDKVLNQENGSAKVYEILTVEQAEDGSLQAQTYVDDTIENVALSESSEKALLTVPYIGFAALALKTTEGRVVLGLGAAFVIVLFILSELLRNDEEDDDDDDYDEEDDDYDEDYDEDYEEEELSRRERRALKKEQKRKEKAEKKAKKRGELLKTETEETEEKPKTNVRENPNTENTEGASEISGDTFDLQAEILKSMAEQNAANESVAVQGAASGMDEVAAVEETADEFEMAIPVYTAEELIEKAKLAGDDPEIIRDEESGITILDYTDII